MLGYVISTGQGAGDRLLAEVAQGLVARNVVLAGVVQSNYEFDPERRCHMDLTVLGQGPIIRISQDRGRHARGCRLDPQGLAEAVRHVDQALERGDVAVLIVNKFGKSELEGEGFREVIGKALLLNVPVVTTVSAGHVAGFLDFADGLASELPADAAQIVAWCLQHCAGADQPR